MYNLFIDDDVARIPHKLAWIELPLVEWTFARSYEEFVGIITESGLPLRVSFDHDLSNVHYMEFHKAWSGDRTLDYNNMGDEKTGYHCCQFLINYCITKKLPLPEIFIHTMNPIGRENIKSLIDSYKKYCSIEE